MNYLSLHKPFDRLCPPKINNKRMRPKNAAPSKTIIEWEIVMFSNIFFSMSFSDICNMREKYIFKWIGW